MTALAFLGAVAAIMVLVLALEVDARSSLRIPRPTGLFTWITSGNWPAKVGGALVIVGVGALLRFAAIEIHVPPTSKLVAGIVIAMALGFGSAFVGGGSARRAVSLCLGGAGFGVAYLTAYSAFGLFQYLSNPAGLALLGLTSIGAGVYAVTRSALSLAVLSMVGAFLGPAFAVEDPGPGIVYGYYFGASVLTLSMVAIRGWRPLIHLSFLFTLAGGVFFAWTASYYTPQYSDVMLPMLLLLTATHVAMPIVERRAAGSLWAERLDLIYMVALPAVVSLLAVWIAPTRIGLATELMCLGAIWAIAAVALQFTRGRGVAAHAMIAVLLLGLGTAARFRDLPWELISLSFAVAALFVAARKPLDRVHSLLAGFVVLFGAVHILMSLGMSDIDTASVGTLVERLIGATLIIVAGVICRRIRQTLDTLLLAVGICWAVFAVGLELIRYNLATVAVVFHGISLLAVLSLWIPGRKIRIVDHAPILFATAVLGTGVWAALNAATPVAWTLLFVAPLALIGVAVRPADPERKGSTDRAVAATLAAIVAGAWAARVDAHMGYAIAYFPLACAVGAGIAAMAIGRTMSGIRGAWVSETADALGIGFAAAIVYSSAVLIGRDVSAIALEVLALAGLSYTLHLRRADGKPVEFSTAAFIVALGLVVQANLMRLVGPPGDQNILGILDLRFPAVTSLLWATAGSALTIWSRKVKSRALWVSGAVLLVASAVKLVLFDFGSLGQLANILAVIAAGGMFLLVGWLAPMPPAAPEEDKPVKGSPPPGPEDEPGPSGWASEAAAHEAQPSATDGGSGTATHADAHQSNAAGASVGRQPSGPQYRADTPSDTAQDMEQPHAQHGLYEYAQAQQGRMSRGDMQISRANDRSMTDAEIDASNRRTAWTIGLVVVAFLVIASQGYHLRTLLRLIGWHPY